MVRPDLARRLTRRLAATLTQIERAFYRGSVELRGRWWNGQWGKLARRDIWLKLEQTWRVEARRGDGDSKIWTHDYPTEADALAAIAAMMDRTGGPDEWRLLSDPPNPINRDRSGDTA